LSEGLDLQAEKKAKLKEKEKERKKRAAERKKKEQQGAAAAAEAEISAAAAQAAAEASGYPPPLFPPLPTGHYAILPSVLTGLSRMPPGAEYSCIPGSKWVLRF
jgi:hypothetical protein